MKERERIPPPAVGGSSLLVIFAVLCLTVFALLSLSTVQAEKRIADASIRSVEAYYEADLQAEKIFARLRAGEMVPGVTGAEDIYTYACSISENQTLMVTLKKTGESWTVLRWQAVAEPGESGEMLPVWNGT